MRPQVWANRSPERPNKSNLSFSIVGRSLCLGSVIRWRTVARYLPDATGLRVKWRPAFLDEAGQLSTTEGTRPAVETVSVKDMITKIDLGNNGLIAAASARKLEKGGYHLQERAVQRGPPGPVVPDVSAALAVLLVHEEVVLQDCFAFEARGPKAAAALQWIKDGGAPAQFEFVEVAWGPAAVVGAASLLDRRSLLTISDGARALGVVWELSLPNDRRIKCGAGGVLPAGDLV